MKLTLSAQETIALLLLVNDSGDPTLDRIAGQLKACVIAALEPEKHAVHVDKHRAYHQAMAREEQKINRLIQERLDSKSSSDPNVPSHLHVTVDNDRTTEVLRKFLENESKSRVDNVLKLSDESDVGLGRDYPRRGVPRPVMPFAKKKGHHHHG